MFPLSYPKILVSQDAKFYHSVLPPLCHDHGSDIHCDTLYRVRDAVSGDRHVRKEDKIKVSSAMDIVIPMALRFINHNLSNYL